MRQGRRSPWMPFITAALVLLLAALCTTANAYIPPVGPGGCVSAPGYPCGSQPGSPPAPGAQVPFLPPENHDAANRLNNQALRIENDVLNAVSDDYWRGEASALNLYQQAVVLWPSNNVIKANVLGVEAKLADHACLFHEALAKSRYATSLNSSLAALSQNIETLACNTCGGAFKFALKRINIDRTQNLRNFVVERRKIYANCTGLSTGGTGIANCQNFDSGQLYSNAALSCDRFEDGPGYTSCIKNLVERAPGVSDEEDADSAHCSFAFPR